MSKQHFSYRISGKQYALEHFSVSKGVSDETMKTLPLTSDQCKEMAYLCVTKGGKAGLDYVKRIERAEARKTKRYLTYGFLTLEDRRQYVYCAGLYCKTDAPVQQRLQLLKEVTEQFAGERCKVEQCTECTLDSGYNPTDIKKHYVTADFTHPVMIWLVA